MTLDELRAAQHMEIKTQSDWQLVDYLDEVNPDVARLDLLPHSEIEVRHLAHTRPSQ